ncbi:MULTISPECIES: hypothetical protein [Methylobacterium]|jgi:hypothetical protein|uniref:hypothetical protein n=1 Tax=Methylobacterium TaxID=407 RepID=UPI000345FA7C|nr:MULTISPECIES: hypothetical protein [Methylobacterium]KQS81998.1 hypothetical protein ASG32_04460 [Methylobacterium sp. Leaf361]MBN4092962.1 hypothetical protein [Methylobacterium sp. OT2]UIN34628.1 hypothetical protein LXM90_26800 [Methylobacterium oryzae]SEF79471.1 hypothetical protein SAMN04488144_10518 [Methylobacterium sp. 190mf]SEH45179.1 hypothetical protein SAMN02799636_02412 [Methylobacterium sp. 275MFSha3.1]
MRSYNLFQLKGEEGLCCAVPEASTVPPFIGAGRWTFGGKLGDGGRQPLDFDGRAADTAVRFNGFYLFQTVDRRFIA